MGSMSETKILLLLLRIALEPPQVGLASTTEGASSTGPTSVALARRTVWSDTDGTEGPLPPLLLSIRPPMRYPITGQSKCFAACR